MAGPFFSSLDDFFDIEALKKAHINFKDMFDKLYYEIKENYPHHLILSNESCIRCENCTYPHGECRFPHM